MMMFSAGSLPTSCVSGILTVLCCKFLELALVKEIVKKIQIIEGCFQKCAFSLLRRFAGHSPNC